MTNQNLGTARSDAATSAGGGIVTLGGDNWDGQRSGEWQKQDPSRAAIHDSIRRLDGIVCTNVTVSTDSPYQYLSVAGGPEWFVVTGERVDASIITFKNSSAGPGEVELVCGGQMASFELAQVADFDAAIASVDGFLDGFPSGLGPEWEVQV